MSLSSFLVGRRRRWRGVFSGGDGAREVVRRGVGGTALGGGVGDEQNCCDEDQSDCPAPDSILVADSTECLFSRSRALWGRELGGGGEVKGDEARSDPALDRDAEVAVLMLTRAQGRRESTESDLSIATPSSSPGDRAGPST